MGRTLRGALHHGLMGRTLRGALHHGLMERTLRGALHHGLMGRTLRGALHHGLMGRGLIRCFGLPVFSLSGIGHAPLMDCPPDRTAIYPSVFSKVNKYAAFFINSFPDIPPRGYAASANALVLTSYLTVDSSFTYLTLAAADAPPKGLGDVILQPPTLCAVPPNQPQALMPASILYNNVLNPFYAITATTKLTVLLPTVLAAVAATPPSFFLPPMLMQFSNATLLSLAGGNTSFNNDTLWIGPSVPTGTLSVGSPTPAVLDLALVQGAIQLGGPGMGFYVQRLTFINPLVMSQQGSGNTSLPLWAFQFNRCVGSVADVCMAGCVVPLIFMFPNVDAAPRTSCIVAPFDQRGGMTRPQVTLIWQDLTSCLLLIQEYHAHHHGFCDHCASARQLCTGLRSGQSGRTTAAGHGTPGKP